MRGAKATHPARYAELNDMKNFFSFALFIVMIFTFIVPSYAENLRISVKADGKTLTATLEDNPASREFYSRLPLTLKMKDLYEREMCYNLEDALPTGKLVSDNYRVGDLIYWLPGKSLVILYKQNGERFSRQYLGHIDSGVELFEKTGDVEVTFEAEALN